jgi:transposase
MTVRDPARPLASDLIWLGRVSVVEGIVERLVPDESWELFQRVVPEAPVRPQGGGRRRHGDREVLAAIVFVATSGCRWQQLPAAAFGPSGATAHRRFSEWSKARVWAKLHRLVLDELGSRGELDWSRCAIDSVNMRAATAGPSNAPWPGSPAAADSTAATNESRALPRLHQHRLHPHLLPQTRQMR